MNNKSSDYGSMESSTIKNISVEDMVPIKCFRIQILTEFAIKFIHECMVPFNEIIMEGPNRSHRPRLLMLLGKLGMGIRRVEAIEDIEMGPVLRIKRDELKEIQKKVKELYLAMEAEGQL